MGTRADKLGQVNDRAGVRTRVTTSHWGAFEVETQGDRIVDTRPFKNDGEPTAIPNILPAAIHHRSRVARPSIRVGWLETRDRSGRGTDAYVEVPWDEALDIAASELDRVRKEYGNTVIFGGSYGWASAGRFHHAPGQVHRFLNTIGGYVSSFGSYSAGCAQAIMPHVFGVQFKDFTTGSEDSWPSIADNTETLVMFGGINPKNSQVNAGGITEHETAGWFERFAEKGIQCINIGPQRTDAPAGCEWLPVKPASDTALMLALAHEIESEGLTDRAFIDRYTAGVDRFLPYLMGKSDGIPKSPEWASPLCGIAPDAIRQLARRMATTRTLITVAWSLQRAEHGEQPYWMSAVLASMVGDIGLPGGGVGYGYGAVGGIGKSIKQLSGMTLPQGRNPVEDVIPVARLADMLLHPGKHYHFNGARRPYPDIRLIYWAGGNPFHHHQDLNRLNEAWKRPETIIVNEPWWTATAKRADIVFPATTSYEREDIGRASLDDYLFDMPKLIPPVGEARDDYDIFSGLADRMGVGDKFTEGREAEDWLRFLCEEFSEDCSSNGVEVPGFDELRKRNWVRLPIKNRADETFFLARFRADPEAAALATPSGKIEIFSETVESFGYADCPGHPVWLPPQEWLGNATEATPLHLVSPQPGDKLHSQLEAALADRPGARPETLLINPEDARTRQIENGDPNGNPNVLTLDVGTSNLGQGCSAHTALVDVSKLD